MQPGIVRSNSRGTLPYSYGSFPNVCDMYSSQMIIPPNLTLRGICKMYAKPVCSRGDQTPKSDITSAETTQPGQLPTSGCIPQQYIQQMFAYPQMMYRPMNIRATVSLPYVIHPWSKVNKGDNPNTYQSYKYTPGPPVMPVVESGRSKEVVKECQNTSPKNAQFERLIKFRRQVPMTEEHVTPTDPINEPAPTILRAKHADAINADQELFNQHFVNVPVAMKAQINKEYPTIGNKPVPVAVYRIDADSRTVTDITNQYLKSTVINSGNNEAKLTGQILVDTNSGGSYDHGIHKSTSSLYRVGLTNSFRVRRRRNRNAVKKPYHCSLCPHNAAGPQQLIVHERTHSGEKPYACSQCPYRAAAKQHLKAHEAHHTGIKPFRCRTCQYTSSRKADLVMHRRTHTGDKPFKCPICPFRAAQSGNVRVHKLSHIAKPFRCTQCDFSTTQKATMDNHERLHAHTAANLTCSI